MKLSKLLPALLVAACWLWSANASATVTYTATTIYGQDQIDGLYWENVLSFQISDGCVSCGWADMVFNSYTDTLQYSANGNIWNTLASDNNAYDLSILNVDPSNMSNDHYVNSSGMSGTISLQGYASYSIISTMQSDSSLYIGWNGNDYPMTAVDTKWVSSGGAAPTSTVPEPASLALLGIGLVGLGITRKRKNKTRDE